MSVSEEGGIGEIGQLDSPRSPLLIWGDAWDSFAVLASPEFHGDANSANKLSPGSPVAPGGGKVGRNQLAVLFPVQSTSTAYPFILQSWSRDWFALLLGYSP